LTELGQDPHFAANALRMQNRETPEAVTVSPIRSRPAAYWPERLRKADILCGSINNFADPAADPHLCASLPPVDPVASSIPLGVDVPARGDGAFDPTRRPTSPNAGTRTKSRRSSATRRQARRDF